MYYLNCIYCETYNNYLNSYELIYAIFSSYQIYQINIIYGSNLHLMLQNVNKIIILPYHQLDQQEMIKIEENTKAFIQIN